MAGVEAEKIVPNTEEKTTTEPTIETPKETVQTDDSATAVEVEIKGEEVPKVEKEEDKAPVETPATVEEKDVKTMAEAPVAEEKPAVEGKAV